MFQQDNSGPGYFDQGALARVQGENIGRIQGHAQGRAQGYQEGWDEAVAKGNEQMALQLEYTRQHVADKEALVRQIDEQQTLIAQLTERLDAMEHENTELREIVNALRSANDRLKNEVHQITDKYHAQTEAYNEQLWRFNRNMVFMKSVRTVLEDLTSGDTPQANQVRQMFARRYTEQVTTELRNGTIRVSPEKDEAFAKAFPRSHKFIKDMLDKVAEHSPEQPHAAATRSNEPEDHSVSM